MNYCDDVECQYYKQGVCISADRYHTADRFCTTGRRKTSEENYNGLMKANNPNCHSSGGKYKSNRVALLK